MRPSPIRPAAALLASLALAALLAPDAASQTRRFEGRTTVVAVEVPVHVILDGEPLRGLTADDFEVREGRKRRKIVDFEVVDLAVGGAAGGGPGSVGVPAAAARRHFLFLFDLSFSAPSAILRSRRAALELLTGGMHPMDLVAVATYTEAKGAELVLGFTSDRAQAAYAVETLGVADPVARFGDPLRLAVADLEAGVAAANLGQGGGSSPGAALGLPNVRDLAADVLLTALRDLSTLSGQAQRQDQLGRIQALSSAFAELADLMRTVDGRKHVVYFSEGFDTTAMLGTTDRQRVEEINRAASRGELWRVDSDERFGNRATRDDLTRAMEHFRKADCTVHSIDITGLRGQEEAAGAGTSGQEGLFILAEQTGGEFLRNFNDLGEAMGEVLERTAVTYVLVIEPQETELDGAYHELEVRLRDGPRGARVVHRPGYWAPRPYTELTPAERQLDSAELVLSGREGGEVATRVLAAAFKRESPFAAGADEAYVLTAVEIDGPSLMGEYRGDGVPVEIYAYALDPLGRVRDFFSQAVALDLTKVGHHVLYRGFKFVGHLDLAPGRYDVRVLVRNGLTGASGVETVAVDVPSFAGGEPALAPPLFIEPEGHWLVIAEQREEGGDRYPLSSRGRMLMPAASPVLFAGSDVPVLLVAHALGDEVAARGELVPLDGDGAPRPVEVAIENRFPTRVDGVERLAARISAGEVPPGEYELRVVVEEAAAGRSAVGSIPVRCREAMGS